VTDAPLDLLTAVADTQRDLSGAVGGQQAQLMKQEGRARDLE